MIWGSPLRAIDLYAGIGGWSLGLRLAGIDIVASYEWWQPAIDTHNGNHGGTLKPVNIRELKVTDLPANIDMVVGSPPCTEFSYANKGGGGNLAEGMIDLVKFFEVVDHLKPKFWAMENVPRVAGVLTKAFADSKSPLFKFRHLKPQIEVFDFSEYGTPQARRRCIATNLPLEELKAFRSKLSLKSLGDVVTAMAQEGVVVDPVWGVELPSEKLTETKPEPALNAEELRMNRDAKTFHPVYNNMAFPDSMSSPARTVTATCTRVSRESIVIADPQTPDQFRRLTIRERASLQGFPITYQFYAKSFTEKAKMVGNAIPPTFCHLVGLLAQGKKAQDFDGYGAVSHLLSLPAKEATSTPPESEGRTYPLKRSFRAAIPHLRFKSGMRFDLSNQLDGLDAKWQVRFFFGPSKDIREVDLDGSVSADLTGLEGSSEIAQHMATAFTSAEQKLHETSPGLLQQAWTHRSGGMGPFEVVDELGDLAAYAFDALEGYDSEPIEDFVIAIAEGASDNKKLVSESKLRKHAKWVLAGILIGEWFNTLSWHEECRKAA